jgi:hypothetical protein
MFFRITESVPGYTHLSSFETYEGLDSTLRPPLVVLKAECERRQFL